MLNSATIDRGLYINDACLNGWTFAFCDRATVREFSYLPVFYNGVPWVAYFRRCQHQHSNFSDKICI